MLNIKERGSCSRSIESMVTLPVAVSSKEGFKWVILPSQLAEKCVLWWCCLNCLGFVSFCA